MRLENWGVVLRPKPYQPPEAWAQALSGNVYDHPEYSDGSLITTSAINAPHGDNAILTESGRVYELGVVAQDYEELYPNARERLFNSLQLKKESQND